MGAPLATRVRRLLDEALTVYGDPHAVASLSALRVRLDDPLRVAIAGRVKSGKSTLLNALVGEPLAATDAGECTSVVTWYRHGRRYRAFAQPRGGELDEIGIARGNAAVRLDLQGHVESTLERLVVEWPASVLEQMTLIDTPGLGSLSTELSDRTTELMDPEDEGSQADAVVYLARHLHGHDVRFLEAFQDDDAGNPNPVNAVCVLARADEIGGGRLDALESAARVPLATGPTLRSTGCARPWCRSQGCWPREPWASAKRISAPSAASPKHPTTWPRSCSSRSTASHRDRRPST